MRMRVSSAMAEAVPSNVGARLPGCCTPFRSTRPLVALSTMTTEHTLPPVPLSGLEERRWIVLAHLGGLLSFIGPLVVWLIYRDRSDAVEREAKEALNAQVTYAAAALALYVVGGALALVLIGFVFIIAAAIVQLIAFVLAIVAAVRSNTTGTYRYPLTYRFLQENA